jgi:hypothetical protein
MCTAIATDCAVIATVIWPLLKDHAHQRAGSTPNGTSLAGPVWAAIIAGRDSDQGKRSGNVNPWLYRPQGPLPVAATGNGIFPSTPGYDMATGIGTPEMAALITSP